MKRAQATKKGKSEKDVPTTLVTSGERLHTDQLLRAHKLLLSMDAGARLVDWETKRPANERRVVAYLDELQAESPIGFPGEEVAAMLRKSLGDHSKQKKPTATTLTSAPAEMRQRRIGKLLDKIIAEMGGDRSESTTEAFLGALDSAVIIVKKDVRASHKQGLCYDCVAALARIMTDL